MYVPEAFAVDDPAETDALLAQAGLAVLATHGPQGLFASHLPFVHDAKAGLLIGHLAQANPHPAQAPDGTQALAVFTGPDAYVSPNWYPSKAEHGRTVPTWNYEAVQVTGRLTWFSDRDRLVGVIDALTQRFEAGFAQPWRIDDLPPGYLDRLLPAIIGVEIRVERVTAKRKLSQNRTPADFQGVIDGLVASGRPGQLAVAERMCGLNP